MRSKSREAVVEEFHKAMGQDINAPWSPDLLGLRINLIKEEVEELSTEVQKCIWESVFEGEVNSPGKAALLKELTDLQYVISGMAVSLGLPLQTSFVRVHNSNMSKLGEDGKPIYREDGKVLKGPNYKAPDLSDLV